ncbi:DUF1642 domain-containing protein [Streptococcus ruminicola]|uniref:DUF1642 domain-containing protein n=1 Tax=Streptococcus ruminicola TaxID=2686210 RepID=UPI003F64223D
MNKQEAIERIKNIGTLNIRDKVAGQQVDMVIKNEVLDIVSQINEPEKPVLTKEEAEWVDKLTEFFDTPDALYRITRCGYSHWFTFDFCGDTYELPIEEDTDYAELNIIKERLVNAVIYGYEVEKEKLYTVELPSPNCPTDGKIKPLYLANNNEVTTNLSRAMEIAEDKANNYPDWKFKPLKTIESFAGDIILEVKE